MLIAGTKPGDRWYRERLLLSDENDVLAVQTLQEIYDEVWGAGAYKCVGVQSEQVVFGGGNIHCITQQEPTA